MITDNSKRNAAPRGGGAAPVATTTLRTVGGTGPHPGSRNGGGKKQVHVGNRLNWRGQLAAAIARDAVKTAHLPLTSPRRTPSLPFLAFLLGGDEHAGPYCAETRQVASPPDKRSGRRGTERRAGDCARTR
jgi:hypothetical protein